MKFLMGFVIGLALGFAAAMVVASRRGQERDEVMWAGTDAAPPTMPQGDGMAAPTAPSPA